MDLIISSNNIVTENGIISGKILIDQEKIVGIVDKEIQIEAKNYINALDKTVIPGLIDTHVHIRFPAFPDWEDVYTGTSAAAAGGITTIFEMPVSSPGVRSLEILKHRISLAEKDAVVDVAFYAGGGHGANKEYVKMAEEGIIGFKIFLHEPYPGREDDFYGIYTVDDGELYSDLKKLKKTNKLICFHAENNEILKMTQKELELGKNTDYQSHSYSHPVIAEVESVAKIINLSEDLDVTVAIKHVSSPKSAELIRQAKLRGVKVYAETCPHYLFSSEKDLIEKGPFAKINPPLRSEYDRDELWSYIIDGTIDYIGTDHAPFSKESKLKGMENIFMAQSGVPGLETELPLFLNAVSEGKLTIEQLVKITSTNQAKIFGIDDQKGSINVGKDADLVIVDFNQEYKIDNNTMKTKAKEIATLYNGKKIKGKIDTTILRGNIIYQDNNIKVDPGYGSIIRSK